MTTATEPVTNDEVDAWMITLYRTGHLFYAAQEPSGAWTLQLTADDPAYTLPTSTAAMQCILALLLDLRDAEQQQAAR
jgi:hypothetical protein